MNKLFFCALFLSVCSLSADSYSSSSRSGMTSNPSSLNPQINPTNNTNPYPNSSNPNMSPDSNEYPNSDKNPKLGMNDGSSYGTSSTVMKDSLNSEDSSVLQNIRDNLSNYQGVSVSAYRGDVTLRGTVATQSDKDRIERDIKRISGVRSVDNQIQVGGTSNKIAPRY